MLDKGTFIFTRNLLLRYVSFIYAVAYLVALYQNEGLLGSKGLLPAHLYLKQIHHHVNDHLPAGSGTLMKTWRLWEACPSLLWFMSWEDPVSVDRGLQIISTTGLVIALGVVITGCANMPLMIIQWLLYHSIVNVGQRWYSFGWESQLLETGFLVIFLCPFISLKKYSNPSPTSFIVIMLFRWLIFRIMIGAGLIKIRGDRCWRDLTCMDYHYETQPVPNPLAYYLHYYPQLLHKTETLGNHIVELIFPWFLLLPRPFTILGGIMQILFQVMIIISGNLSFLNWLTIAPCIACFDDAFLLKWLPLGSKLREACRQGITKASEESLSGQKGDIHEDPHQVKPLRSRTRRRQSSGYICHTCVDILLVVVIGFLSIPVIQNLISTRQIMNTSFDSLRVVNTYGAFGSITKIRHEVILLGTHSSNPSSNADWLEYEFHCKPGNVSRRPCLISPYHYRLDWLMWFAAFQSYEQNPWLIHLMAKLLKNDPVASSLLANNPFMNNELPKWIRADLYRYKFTPWKTNSSVTQKDWWRRKRVKEYIPPVTLTDLKPYLQHFGWPNDG